MAAEIRIVVYDEQNQPIQADTLWRIANDQAAKDLAHGLAERLKRRPRKDGGSRNAR